MRGNFLESFSSNEFVNQKYETGAKVGHVGHVGGRKIENLNNVLGKWKETSHRQGSWGVWECRDAFFATSPKSETVFKSWNPKMDSTCEKKCRTCTNHSFAAPWKLWEMLTVYRPPQVNAQTFWDALEFCRQKQGWHEKTFWHQFSGSSE